jgi:hypothetical protein
LPASLDFGFDHALAAASARAAVVADFALVAADFAADPDGVGGFAF